MPLAAYPSFGLVVVVIGLFVASVRRWRHHRRDAVMGVQTDVILSMVLLALGVNALVAGLALIGVVTEQGTITFWSALVRSVAIVLGAFVAIRWWRD